MTRATTAEATLEAIYAAARILPPVETDEDIFRGHPLSVTPKGAAVVFYAFRPSLFMAIAIVTRRSAAANVDSQPHPDRSQA